MGAWSRDWVESGRDASFLASGSRLEQLEVWQAAAGLATTRDERDFVLASLRRRDDVRAEESARQAREQMLQRRSLVRLRALVAVFALLGLVASGLAVVAMSQRQQAQGATRAASARELAAAALANLDVDPERSILLAMAAVDRTRTVDGDALPEAVAALHRAVVTSRVVLTVPGIGGSLDWSRDGAVFVTEGPEDTGLIDLRDAATGDTVRSWHGHDVDVNRFDRPLEVLDADTGRHLYWLGPDDGIERAIWSPDSQFLAATSRSEVTVVDRSGSELATFSVGDGMGVGALTFNLDGDLLATELFPLEREEPLAAHAAVWDWREGRVVTTLAEGAWVGGLAFDPTGPRLAAGAAPAVWDLDGRQLTTLAGPSGHILKLAYSPDGSQIATGSTDGTVRLWDAATGLPTLELPGHQGLVTGLAFSPDGRRLATTSRDGTARVWALHLDDLLEIARGKLTRGLSDEECRQYLHVDACPDR